MTQNDTKRNQMTRFNQIYCKLRWQVFAFFWPPTPYIDIFYHIIFRMISWILVQCVTHTSMLLQWNFSQRCSLIIHIWKSVKKVCINMYLFSGENLSGSNFQGSGHVFGSWWMYQVGIITALPSGMIYSPISQFISQPRRVEKGVPDRHLYYDSRNNQNS